MSRHEARGGVVWCSFVVSGLYRNKASIHSVLWQVFMYRVVTRFKGTDLLDSPLALFAVTSRLPWQR